MKISPLKFKPRYIERNRTDTGLYGFIDQVHCPETGKLLCVLVVFLRKQPLHACLMVAVRCIYRIVRSQHPDQFQRFIRCKMTCLHHYQVPCGENQVTAEAAHGIRNPVYIHAVNPVMKIRQHCSTKRPVCFQAVSAQMYLIM